MRESLHLYQKIGNKQSMAYAYVHLGISELGKANFSEAQVYLRKGIRLFQEVNRRSGVSWALGQLGYLAIIQGDLVEAERVASESLHYAEQVNTPIFIAAAKNQFWYIASFRREYAEAYQYALDALTITREMGNYRAMTSDMTRTAWSLYGMDENEAAAQYLDEALRISADVPYLTLNTAVLISSVRFLRLGEYVRAVELMASAFEYLQTSHSIFSIFLKKCL